MIYFRLRFTKKQNLILGNETKMIKVMITEEPCLSWVECPKQEFLCVCVCVCDFTPGAWSGESASWRNAPQRHQTAFQRPCAHARKHHCALANNHTRTSANTHITCAKNTHTNVQKHTDIRDTDNLPEIMQIPRQTNFFPKILTSHFSSFKDGKKRL